MQRITSRQNPLVARFREVARGEAPELLLLDGTHLVSEALAASIRVRQAVVSSDALERSDVVAILDEIAKEYAGKLVVAKLNIDENSDTPAKFGVRGIPTLMLFKDGNVVATKVGAQAKSQLSAFIDSNL